MPFRNEFASLFRQDATIAAVVFGLVVIAVGGAMLLSRRRRRRGQEPSRKGKADRLELGYVLGLTGIVAFLVVSSFVANARDFPRPRPSVVVRVTGYQWCWTFRYANSPVTIDGQCNGGQPPTLVLPAGEPAELDITSTDVVHAFWVSYLRVKAYAYPGHVDSITITVPHLGTWIGRCAQLCGVLHYEMDFKLTAVPPAAFCQYLQAHGGTS